MDALSASALADLGSLAARDGAGQVLVSQSVADAAPPAGVVFSEAGEVELEGFARAVRLLEARWA